MARVRCQVSYYVCEGQDDNIGDVVLRRRLLERLQELGDVHVCVGTASEDFIAALGVRSSDVVHRSFKAFLLALTAAALRGRHRLIFAFNPGEVVLTGLDAAINLTLLPVLVLVRLRGGEVVRTGAGLRDWRPLQGRLLRLTGRVATVVAWRDTRTADLLGIGDTVPDWALGLRPLADGGTRRHLAVSLRSDLPAPSDTWCDAIRDAASELHLTPLVVSQVRRDDDAARLLAERLECGVVDWQLRTHSGQEAAVREAYREAGAVVSDRLHSLALGCVEGAAPVGAFEHPDVKIGRHFDVAHLPDVSADVSGWTRWQIRDFVVDRARRGEVTETAMATTRDELAALDLQIGHPAESTRVLLSLSAPDGTTRFVDQVCSGLPRDVQPLFFSWRRALTARYDAFHVHWPESLVGGKGVLGVVTPALYALLLARLTVCRTPVVRTLHNLAPHEDVDRVSLALLHWTDKITTAVIRINRETPFPVDDVLRATILHGHYRDRFEPYRKDEVQPNTLLFAGMLRAYKGVDELLAAVPELGPQWRLCIVGAPVDADLADRVRAAATEPDTQVRALLRFVADDELVTQVTRAEAVVLPYHELHNSGMLLVALSLDRPVIVPDTPTTRALAAEVGEHWVIRVDGTLTGEALRHAVMAMRDATSLRAATAPVLDERDWSAIGRKHAHFYREAAQRRLGASRWGRDRSAG